MPEHDLIVGDVRQLREDAVMMRDMVKAQNDVIAILRQEVVKRGDRIQQLEQQIDARKKAYADRQRKYRSRKTG